MLSRIEARSYSMAADRMNIYAGNISCEASENLVYLVFEHFSSVQGLKKN